MKESIGEDSASITVSVTLQGQKWIEGKLTEVWIRVCEGKIRSLEAGRW